MSLAASPQRPRRSVACDECKRRKVRCSAEPVCANCSRDKKRCVYSAPSHRVSELQRSIDHYETLLRSIGKAWTKYVPGVSLEQALARLDIDGQATPHGTGVPCHTPQQALHLISNDAGASLSEPDTPEQTNAEDYEFDESQEAQATSRGSELLALARGKAGYTGPQSATTAFKVLRAIPPGCLLDDTHESLTLAASSDLQARPLPAFANVDTLINDYFQFYHPAYPLLHEGLFRARCSGAVPKPRDGSWLPLYNSVLAMGAFVGSSAESEVDVPYYQAARDSLSLSVIEKGSLGYVQGLTIMASYLLKKNKPNAGFALIGVAWSMAMAIGLHREFGTFCTSHHTMEVRRRAWWTLFICVSDAQLLLGRPPASLIGVNLRIPTNLDDVTLAVDLEDMPGPQEGPTVTTCLIAHIKLAQIANEVQAEMLTSQIPLAERVATLRTKISRWTEELPHCFNEDLTSDLWFELPKRNLLWRAYYLRIVLERPSLFRAIEKNLDLDTSNKSVSECILAADTCVTSICRFLEVESDWRRGFASFAAHWLMSASFVHAICFAYALPSPSKDRWRNLLEQAVGALQRLDFAHDMARRARHVFEKLIDSNRPQTSLQTFDRAQPHWDSTFFGDNTLAQMSAQYLGFEHADFLNLQGPEPTGLDSASTADLMWAHMDQPGPGLFPG